MFLSYLMVSILRHCIVPEASSFIEQEKVNGVCNHYMKE